VCLGAPEGCNTYVRHGYLYMIHYFIIRIYI
jgi:hypothetical protein